MKVKTTKDILILLKKNKYDDLDEGLCTSLHTLYICHNINKDEYDKTIHYIKRNRPNKYNSWSWSFGEIKSRLEWLDLHIAKLTKS